jgi:hypothetical protein
VRHSRSLLMLVLSFAVVTAVTAARPAVATAQDGSSPGQQNREPAARAFDALAGPDARIAFGVRRGAIQHVVARSPFEDAYAPGDDERGPVTLVTVHRFGQRGGGVRVVSNQAHSTLRLGPSEVPLRLSPHPPVMWNLADRIRIAFGARPRSLQAIDPAMDRSVTPIGSVAIEFGDRR